MKRGGSSLVLEVCAHIKHYDGQGVTMEDLDSGSPCIVSIVTLVSLGYPEPGSEQQQKNV